MTKKELVAVLVEAGLPADMTMKKDELEAMYEQALSDGVLEGATEEAAAEEAAASEEVAEESVEEVEATEEVVEAPKAAPQVLSVAKEYLAESDLWVRGQLYKRDTLVSLLESDAELLLAEGVIRELKRA